MTFQNFTFEIDADGIALITWNMPGRSMNVIDAKVMEELAAIVERVATDRRRQGRSTHLRQGGVLRRRRFEHAGDAKPHVRGIEEIERRGGGEQISV